MRLTCSSPRHGASVLLALALCSASACGDDGTAEGSASGPSTSATASGTTSTADSDPSISTTTAVVDDSGTSTTAGPGTFGTSTTGELELCNGWNDALATPSLELQGAGGETLVSGGAFPIECGGQGSWMFPLYPQMGGWELASPLLTFALVEVVVEGFPGPFGSFYIEQNYLYSLDCGGFDTLDGGFSHDCITVLPPDDIADLGTLDGAPATIHVELEVDGGDPIVIDLVDMTLSAPPEVVSQECFY
ncbi:hypothetical protein [Paraliomyxa miuraensis]|uniref:hypothetical protein n=1 Tax=Paraliomyxa miuraensis TaxID=376150 RepID=UPI00224FF235|nr:hypothetical protein [Paraliomyxa miuraensis]